MKRLFIAFISAILIASCAQDKGNYIYEELDELVINIFYAEKNA